MLSSCSLDNVLFADDHPVEDLMEVSWEGLDVRDLIAIRVELMLSQRLSARRIRHPQLSCPDK